MVQIEYLPLVLTGLGLMASILYYTMNLRNANKTQQLALENRRAQLYMQLFLRITSEDFMKRSIDLLRLNYSNQDEFFQKFNEDNKLAAKWVSQLWHIDGIGFLMSEGLLEPEMVYNFGGGQAHINHWNKWKPIIEEMRYQRSNPEFLKWFEYLSELMKELRIEKGLNNTP